MFALQVILAFFWLYWLFIGLFGFGKAKETKKHAPKKSFAILVPAHNEEDVVEHLLRNLISLDYPSELYDIYLIADNCTDRTALIGRLPNVIVLEHTSLPGERKGKPYAIKYALDNLNKRYDAVTVFDADNLVTRNYLKEMNNLLCEGHQLVQCYLDSKNPNDNWQTLAYATAYYYMNRSWQLAKSRLGLGNAIGGTGFTMSSELLDKIGWTARSLTEDLEFTMQALLSGVSATWAHHARVYDEKPTNFKVSVVQRLRWNRGHWDVCIRYAPRLLWRFLTKFDIRSLDGFLYLVNPGKVVLGVGVSAFLLYDRFTVNHYHYLIPIWAWLVFMAVSYFHVIYATVVDSNQRIRLGKALLSFILFNYTYTPLFVWGLITFRNKTWKRTKHTRAISEIEISA